MDACSSTRTSTATHRSWCWVRACGAGNSARAPTSSDPRCGSTASRSRQIHLGVRLAAGVRSGQKTIVGIVGNVKYIGLDLTPPAEVYVPHAQNPVDGLTI